MGRLVGELPRLAERAERLSAEMDRMGSEGFRLDPETIEGIGRSEARAGRWGRAALVVIAVVVVIAAVRWLL
jgi:ubiquinone biosynthesis protein